jgi:tRNA pseudouridine38-40 synthase
MKEVFPYLMESHDFKHFSVHNGSADTICNISGMNLTQDNLQIIITIEGNRFLRKMVRGIIGFIYDVGRRRFTPYNTVDALAGKIKDIFFAPPQGLFLMEVRY